MSDVPSALEKIQIESVQFRDAVSESTMQALGGSLNALIDCIQHAPKVTRYTSGSGSHVWDTGCKFARVRIVAPGGGGASVFGSGTDAADVTFGSSLLTAGGGKGGSVDNSSTGYAPGGAGGTNTINSPAIKLVDMPGCAGGYGANFGTSAIGGPGGGTGYGPGGQFRVASTSLTGFNTPTTPGAGGTGGVLPSGGTGCAGGGGGGGYLEALILAPSGSAPWSIGSSGQGKYGTSFTSSGAGDHGARGEIIVEEWFTGA